MNPNIEQINDHLLAVRFSLIPYISEIDYRPDAEVPKFTEMYRTAEDGTLVLNKDHVGYNVIRTYFIEVMTKSNKRLRKELASSKLLKKETDQQKVYRCVIEEEILRREKERWWRLHGYSKNSNQFI